MDAETEPTPETETEAETEATAEAERLASLEKQVAEFQAREETLRGQVLRMATDAALNEAASGVAFSMPAARGHALRLLREEIEAVFDEDGNPLVRLKATGEPAATGLAERLKDQEFRHFLAPSTQGGTAVPGQHRGRPPAVEKPAIKPGSLEAIAASHRKRLEAQRGKRAFGWPGLENNP